MLVGSELVIVNLCLVSNLSSHIQVMLVEKLKGLVEKGCWFKLNIAKQLQISHAGLFSDIKQCPGFFFH